jgi:Xaa-Pro aminopeptidase
VHRSLLELFDPQPTRARRERLTERLAGVAALVPAGAAPSRNYAANTYPFRASSHFLYLVGLPLEGAFALVHEGRLVLFHEPRSADDAIWHGEAPTVDEVAETIGAEARPLDALPEALGRLRVGTLPAPDLATRTAQATLLGRDPAAGTAEDHVLRRAIIALRLVHDDAARAELVRAADATIAAHRAGMAVSRPGATEAEVCATMEAALAARGMGTSYPSIVTVHGEVLHNPHHLGRLESGDLLLADVGAETPSGFAGDVTRTWPVTGAFSPTQRALYDVVLAAHEAALAEVRPGTRFRDVHLAAARALTRGLVDLGILRGDVDELVADDVHALFFPHGVGHLLGLDVHDMEDLGDHAGYAPGRTRSASPGLRYLRLDRDLTPHMAVTIEPGFYQIPALLAEDAPSRRRAGDRLRADVLARFSDVRGIRIEDDVLVTDAGAVRLTEALPRTADAIEAAVGEHA